MVAISEDMINYWKKQIAISELSKELAHLKHKSRYYTKGITGPELRRMNDIRNQLKYLYNMEDKV